MKGTIDIQTINSTLKERTMEAFIGVGGCIVSAVFIVLIVLVRMGLVLIYQYQRGVVFMLGKYQGTREPGLSGNAEQLGAP